MNRTKQRGLTSALQIYVSHKKPCHTDTPSGLFSLKGTCAQFTNRGGKQTVEKEAGLGEILSKSGRGSDIAVHPTDA